MGELTNTNVAELVGNLKAFYEPKGEACGQATPKEITLLLGRLADYTQEVKEAASREGLASEWKDLWTGETKTRVDKHNPQFAVDMANWEMRLAHYQRVLSYILPSQSSTAEGCKLIYKNVTAPLLDGIWYEILPGVNLNAEEKNRITSREGHPDLDVTTTLGGQDHPPGHSNAKPPDLIAPFTLGNQVLVWKEHQEERLRLLWKDLKEQLRPKPPGPEIWNWLILAGVAVVSIAGIVVLVRFSRARREKERLMQISSDGSGSVSDDAPAENPTLALPEATPPKKKQNKKVRKATARRLRKRKPS